jgi:hypothetical protein
MDRCLNNIYGYCRGGSKLIPYCEERTRYNYLGNPVIVPIDTVRCELNELECGQYLSFSEVLVLTGFIPAVPQSKVTE